MDYGHFWEDWSSDDDNEHLAVERRQYKMKERINLDNWDDVDFAFRSRVSKRTFHIVLSLIEIQLEPTDPRSRYIKPAVQLLIGLRFYALGSMQISIADFAGVCISSVCRILKRVSAAIASISNRFIKMPETHEEMVKASTAYYRIASFPRTIGAIDCTHVKIHSPGGENSEHFRNRKGFFSLNVQTVADADLKIINIIARWPSSTHDQRIFNNSHLKNQLVNGHFGQFIIVGDSGYQNTMYLATPLLDPATQVEELYNESQIRTRNVVERSYGVLKRRFLVLSLGMRVQLPTVQDIIVSCATMHNICIDERDAVPPPNIPNFEAILAVNQTDAAPTDTPNTNKNDQNVRAQLLNHYFTALLRNQNAELLE